MSVFELLKEVTDEAKKQGLSQKKLAIKAGMTPVGLSKAKQRGDIRASSLAALGAVLGLQLKFESRQTVQTAKEAVKSGQFFTIANEQPEEQGNG